MGNVGDYWRESKDAKKELRARHGIECPKCKEVRPGAHPSILLPQQRCRVDGYIDPRPRIKHEE